MPNLHDSQIELVKELDKNKSLLDILISCEQVFDSLDVYAYPNWFKGTVVGGPYIRRHWVKLILQYDYADMPSPDGGLVLTNHGIKVGYMKATKQVTREVKTAEDYQPGTKMPKIDHEKVWLVRVLIPRHYIDGAQKEDLSVFDRVADVDDASEADVKGLGKVDNEDQQPQQPTQ